FMIKILSKLVIEDNFLYMIKDIYYKIPTANLILNGKRVNAFLLRLVVLRSMFNIGLEVLASTIRQQKEIKGIGIGKEEVKLSLFAEDMTLYIES
ncbi:LORF2 protein, partial [Crocuta crocuta]